MKSVKKEQAAISAERYRQRLKRYYERLYYSRFTASAEMAAVKEGPYAAPAAGSDMSPEERFVRRCLFEEKALLPRRVERARLLPFTMPF